MRPFIAALMGHHLVPRIAVARLAGGISRRNAERRLTVPVRFLEPGRVAPLEYHGSAHLASIARAEGLVAVPAGDREIPDGALVEVRLLVS